MDNDHIQNGYELGFDPSDVFLTKECARFAYTWQQWRKGKLLPDRSDINLPDVTDLMPSMAILDVQSAKVAIIRLIGTDFQPHFGEEITGANFVELAPPVDRPLRGYRQMCMSRHPCASVSRIRAESDENKIIITEIAAFPVAASKDGAPPQVFACTHMIQQDFVPADDETLDGVQIPIATEFNFLDIGAGKPSEIPAKNLSKVLN
jgi:hypothetical protein